MKTPFVNLKHIDASIIDQKYNFIVYKEKNKNEKKNTISKTKIADITKDNLKSSYFSYIDEAKNDHICIITMKDVILNKELPVKTDINCFWCRHNFSSRPIGCPITFKNTRLYKKYYSEITKNNYCLQETISTKQLEDSKDSKNDNYYSLEIQPSNYYLTDGIFCSFNCCFAFIDFNKLNPLYSQSLNLLKKMYYDLFPNYDISLMKAPHWRLLKDYGGELSIEEFRKNFYKVDYIENNDFTTIFPHQKSMGLIFEKRIKL
jgi:hypothetical protein